jgi:NAD-dependent SIR2 family protein deacetylase
MHGNLRECQCRKCGRTFYLSLYILERREPKSCGCIQIKRSTQKYKETVDKKKVKKLMQAYRLAKAKGDTVTENQLYKEILEIRGKTSL